ncbi:site-specific integrase [Breoghania sp.]|uniref:site-specific integrase n=1 Tax=Breoghania sp. TaxID=2065378 RepID=UPI00261815F7|nr:site-specific integrase [Breoghania sp.]MDJ0933525.1 site-specific integrase [Breoghania sp.]
MPNGIRARHRRLLSGEFDRLKQAAPLTRNPLTLPAVELAIETAMRRSELLELRWEDVDAAERLAHLEDTKNGQPRSVPLTDRALSILEHLPRVSDRVLPLTETALRQSWERLVARAGIEDLHFHDLRHEAISRFFERGLTIPEVALISGYKDPRMLFRYTHLKPENVVAKLNALEAA